MRLKKVMPFLTRPSATSLDIQVKVSYRLQRSSCGAPSFGFVHVRFLLCDSGKASNDF